MHAPHEQFNVPRLGAHDTARVFMKWARRGLLPREYRHKGLFEGGLKEFTGSMQDLDAVALFAMHPIILRCVEYHERENAHRFVCMFG